MLTKLGSRATLAAASLALVVVACNFNGDFFITKNFTLTANNGTYAVTKSVDLAKEAPGAWKRRSDLKSLDVVAVVATVETMRAGANVPVTGTLVLQRAGLADVTGTWSHTLAATAPDSLSITLPPEADALVMDAIRGDGKFDIKATATTAGNIDIDVKVVLQVGIKYHVGP
jgi:hypothetical protein